MNVTMKIKHRYFYYGCGGWGECTKSKWIDGIPRKKDIKTADEIQISRFFYNEHGREIGWDRGIVFNHGKKQKND